MPVIDYFTTTESGYYYIAKYSISTTDPFTVVRWNFTNIGDSDISMFLTRSPIVTTYDALPERDQFIGTADSHGNGFFDGDAILEGGNTTIYKYLQPTPGHKPQDSGQFSLFSVDSPAIFTDVETVCGDVIQ